MTLRHTAACAGLTAVTLALPQSATAQALHGERSAPFVTSTLAPLPRLLAPNYSTKFKVRPATIEMCATGGCPINGGQSTAAYPGDAIRWRTWTRSRASAQATFWLNDCHPTCAEGTFHPNRRALTATRVRKRRFTRLTLTGGRGNPNHFCLHRSDAAYAWNPCATRLVG